VPVLVRGRLELLAQLAAQAGLLLDLAQRRLLEALAGIELALGQGPVVVLGPVDDQDQAVALDDPSGGEDLGFRGQWAA
jgi:hypothetical protein